MKFKCPVCNMKVSPKDVLSHANRHEVERIMSLRDEISSLPPASRAKLMLLFCSECGWERGRPAVHAPECSKAKK